MLSLRQLKKEDPRLAELTEEELTELRDALYETANLAFDIWWYQKFGSKNPIGLSEE